MTVSTLSSVVSVSPLLMMMLVATWPPRGVSQARVASRRPDARNGRRSAARVSVACWLAQMLAHVRRERDPGRGLNSHEVAIQDLELHDFGRDDLDHCIVDAYILDPYSLRGHFSAKSGVAQPEPEGDLRLAQPEPSRATSQRESA